MDCPFRFGMEDTSCQEGCACNVVELQENGENDAYSMCAFALIAGGLQGPDSSIGVRCKKVDEI